MKIKSLICLFLVFIMVASLSACAAKAVPATIDKEGKFVYNIVRSAEASATQEETVKKLRTAMKDNFNCKITIIKDTAFEDFDGNYEILVGDTNREESAKAKEILLRNRVNNARDFIVKVTGDKICINAVTDDILDVAVDWFIHTYCQNLNTWSLLKEDYEFIYCHSSDALVHKVAGENLGAFTVVMPRKTSVLVGLITDEYVDYFTKLNYYIKENDDVDAEEEYEILIDDTSRKESKEVKVEGDNYVIKVVGKKLVVKGGTHLASWRAMKALLEILNGSKSIDWSDGYTINGKYDASEEGAYTLNWHDEFEGSTIDFNKWSDYGNQANKTPATSSLGGKNYKGNVFNECQYTGSDKKDKLIYQADGYMHLGTQRVNDIDFIDSCLSTYWTMIYRYGAIDIFINMAEHPSVVSLWLNAANVTVKGFEERFGKQDRACMAEIDILENFGNNNLFGSNIHRWWSEYSADGATKTSGHKSTMDASTIYSPTSGNSKRFEYNTQKYGDSMVDDFHMISCYWDDKCIKFAFDGKIHCTYNYTDQDATNACALMEYLIVSTNMGSATYGPTYSKTEHESFYESQIDYIRIYQTNSVNSQMMTSWPQNQQSGTTKIFYPDNLAGGDY